MVYDEHDHLSCSLGRMGDVKRRCASLAVSLPVRIARRSSPHTEKKLLKHRPHQSNRNRMELSLPE